MCGVVGFFGCNLCFAVVNGSHVYWLEDLMTKK